MMRIKAGGLVAGLMACMLLLQGCTSSAQEISPTPTVTATEENRSVAWPEDKLDMNAEGIPVLSVYVTDKGGTEETDIETYVESVLAGEMKNDWPLEALKAQAILARTFVLKFVNEKDSQYPNADISTDIKEAQAYDSKSVNDQIRQAVKETKGLVLESEGELPFTWFHAHSGGMTALAKEGLGWNGAEPTYTNTVKSQEPDPDKTPEEPTLEDAAEWKASFPYAEFAAACGQQGKQVKVDGNTKISIEKRGESGRAVTLDVGGVSVSAPELRIALGSTKMRSTLLESLTLEDGKVHMQGKGYGHGVGMSQWGAYGMAKQGKTAEEIVQHYFQNVKIAKLWD